MGLCLSQRNGGSPLEPVMTGRAKRDEVSQVEGCATVRHGLAVAPRLERSRRIRYSVDHPGRARPPGSAATLPWNGSTLPVHLPRDERESGSVRSCGTGHAGPRSQGRRWPRSGGIGGGSSPAHHPQPDRWVRRPGLPSRRAVKAAPAACGYFRVEVLPNGRLGERRSGARCPSVRG